MSGSRTLSGVVRLRDAARTAGTLRVKVEDVSRADAAARPVAEAIVTLAQPLPAGATVPFSVTVPAVSDAISYAVRAHWDCDGSGQISDGDLISTRAYPVLSRGQADRVEIEVQAI